VGGLPVIVDTLLGRTPADPTDAVPDAPAAADPGPTGSDRILELTQRCAWSLVWLAVLATSLDYWGSWSSGVWAAVLAPVMVLVALVGSILVWTGRHPMTSVLQWLGLGAGLVSVAVSEGTGIHGRHFYTTDSAAFNQVATRLFLDGHDPYTSSMAAATRLLHPADQFWTYQVNGAHTLAVSYPAGSFLLQAPVMALGLNHMVTDWVDLAAWLVTGVLIFCMVPRALRWVAPLLLVAGVFAGAFADGGTDALFVPFLVVAVWRWDRWPDRATAWLPGWVGPVSLGVACSIKQTPWFCVPFLVVGVACEARRAGAGGRWGPVRTGLRYGAWVVGSFVVVNLPFIVWSPGAWLRGSLLPMVDPLVADGQGAVTLALHGLTGGVVMPWLSAAAGLALVALLVAFALWEARLKPAWLFLVPLVLFVPDRSLANYLTDFVPAAVVAGVSVVAVAARPPGWADHRPWTSRLSVGAPALGAAVLVVVALTSAPLVITVDRVAVGGVATVDGGLFLRHVDVSVHNTSGEKLDPLFMVSAGGGHPQGFWDAAVLSGEDPVPPGATTEFAIHPSRYTSAPGRGQWWLVEAYTTSPNALSTSSMQQWRLGVEGH